MGKWIKPTRTGDIPVGVEVRYLEFVGPLAGEIVHGRVVKVVEHRGGDGHMVYLKGPPLPSCQTTVGLRYLTNVASNLRLEFFSGHEPDEEYESMLV